MRNKDRYTDPVVRVVTIVAANVEDKNFVRYTTAEGNTLTTRFTNQIRLGVPTKVRITYDIEMSKWRLL